MPRTLKHTRVARAFGALLKRHRLALGLTQEQFAHATGIDISFISRMERGLTQPSIGTFIQLAKAFGMTPQELMMQLTRKLGRG